MPAHLHTINLYKFDDVVSALQKSIRRCDLEQAFFWAGELVQGFKHILYSRLWTIVAEDIGLAAPYLALDLFPLYQEWLIEQKNESLKAQELTMRIIYLLVQAPKNRVVDNLLLYNYFQTKPSSDWIPSLPCKDLQEKIRHLFNVNLFAAQEEKEVDVEAALIQLAACIERRDATNAWYFCNIIDLSTEENDRSSWFLHYLGFNQKLKIDRKTTKKMTIHCWYVLLEIAKENESLSDLLKVLCQLYLGKTGSSSLMLAMAVLLVCQKEKLVYENGSVITIDEIPQRLQELYYHKEGDITNRRQYKVPDYAIDKHTDRGKEPKFAPHNIADLYTEAQKKSIPVHHWSTEEIAKSHGSYKIFAKYVQGNQHSRMSHFFQEGALLKNVPTDWKGEDSYVGQVQRYFLSLEKKYGYQACSGFFILEKMKPIWLKSQENWKNFKEQK